MVECASVGALLKSGALVLMPPSERALRPKRQRGDGTEARTQLCAVHDASRIPHPAAQTAKRMTWSSSSRLSALRNSPAAVEALFANLDTRERDLSWQCLWALADYEELFGKARMQLVSHKCHTNRPTRRCRSYTRIPR